MEQRLSNEPADHGVDGLERNIVWKPRKKKSRTAIPRADPNWGAPAKIAPAVAIASGIAPSRGDTTYVGADPGSPCGRQSSSVSSCHPRVAFLI